MTVFNILTNNVDRKGGHVLEMADGYRQGIDLGSRFHTDYKSRTVRAKSLSGGAPHDEFGNYQLANNPASSRFCRGCGARGNSQFRKHVHQM